MVKYLSIKLSFISSDTRRTLTLKSTVFKSRLAETGDTVVGLAKRHGRVTCVQWTVTKITFISCFANAFASLFLTAFRVFHVTWTFNTP